MDMSSFLWIFVIVACTVRSSDGTKMKRSEALSVAEEKVARHEEEVARHEEEVARHGEEVARDEEEVARQEEEVARRQATEHELHELLSHVTEREKSLRQLRETVAARDERLKEKDDIIRYLNVQVEQLKRRLGDMTSRLTQQHGTSPIDVVTGKEVGETDLEKENARLREKVQSLLVEVEKGDITRRELERKSSTQLICQARPKNACAWMRRTGNNPAVLYRRFCQCTKDPCDADCGDNWENNSCAVLTYRSEKRRNTKFQFKFCTAIFDNKRLCNGTESAIDINYIGLQIIARNIVCRCPNDLEYVQLSIPGPGDWLYSYSCEKPDCAQRIVYCAEKELELQNEEWVHKWTKYYCNCPAGKQCNTDGTPAEKGHRKGRYYYYYYNCTTPSTTL